MLMIGTTAYAGNDGTRAAISSIWAPLMAATDICCPEGLARR
jgi:hypothetical protein